MIAFLFKLWGWKNWIVGGAVALAVAGGGLWLRAIVAERDAARAYLKIATDQLTTAKRVNAENLLALDAVKSRHAAELAALEKDRRGWANRAKAAERIMEEIDASPSTDDAPAAPVLRRTIERLRLDQAAPRHDR